MDILQMSESQYWDKPISVDENLRDDRPRKKRRKYIARAWYVHTRLIDSTPRISTLKPVTSNECKRRKIKCNGENPCYRCGRQRIDCVYIENPRRESTSEPE